MTTPQPIIFACPSCQTTLEIAAHLAGVIGPCPSCRTNIKAPAFSAPNPSPPPQESRPPQAKLSTPRLQQEINPMPAPPPPSSSYYWELRQDDGSANTPTSPPNHHHHPQQEKSLSFIPVKEMPTPSETYEPPSRGSQRFQPKHPESYGGVFPPITQKQAEEIDPIAPTKLTPKPNNFPKQAPNNPRAFSPPEPNKVMPIQGAAAQKESMSPEPMSHLPKSSKISRLPSLLAFLFFAALALAIVFIILRTTGTIDIGPKITFEKYFNKIASKLEKKEWIIDSSTPKEAEKQTSQTSQTSNKKETPPADKKPSLEELVRNVAVEDIPPSLDIPLEQQEEDTDLTEEQKAQKCLNRFLDASNLAARKEYMGVVKDKETQSLLNKPLREAIATRLLRNFRSPIKDPISYYYMVSFEDLNERSGFFNQVIEVYSYKKEDKYLVNEKSFFDLYSDKITAYFDGAPKEEQIKVKIIGEFYHYNDDENIPAYEKKSYVKIKRSPNGKELGRAYFSRSSGIHKEIQSRTKKRSDVGTWAKPTPITAHLTWNFREDPLKPYVELIKIESLNWIN